MSERRAPSKSEAYGQDLSTAATDREARVHLGHGATIALVWSRKWRLVKHQHAAKVAGPLRGLTILGSGQRPGTFYCLVWIPNCRASMRYLGGPTS